MNFDSKSKTSKSNARSRTSLIAMTATALLAVSACSDAEPVESDPAEAPVEESFKGLTDAYQQGVTELGANDYTQVASVDVPAGENIPVHEAGDRIIFSLDDYSLSFESSGDTEAKTFAEGDVHFHPAGLHAIMNTGETPAKFVVFERLPNGALPDGEPAADSDDTPTPDANATETELFSNDAFDVYQVSVKPGARLAPHTGFARAVYSRDDYQIKFHENGKTEDRTFATGDVHFHTPGEHWLENAGDTPADFIVVDYKK